MLNGSFFLESNSPDILSNLDDSIHCGNFSVTSYLHLIWMDSVTHMHGLEVYGKGGLPLAQDLSLENSPNFSMFSSGFTSMSSGLILVVYCAW